MRCVVCREFGPVEALVVEERPTPEPGPTQVLIDVTACGVNYVDGLFVQGRYQIKPPTPFVPGMEVVGRVRAVGADVAGVAVGDRVFANVGLGGYADEAVADHRSVLTLPESLTDGQAATFMQSYMTAWFALVGRGAVAAGETLLVLGAGSGVGLAAVDVGAALGLRVMAAASTDDKRALALDRGAEVVVDSAADDVKALARDWGASATGRGGVDHLYDPIGGELGESCLRALGENGQYLVIGFVAGIPQLPANQVLLRNRRVTGVDWGAWAGRHPAENRAMLDAVLEMIAAGRLRPVEPATYPLAEAARALTDLAERRVAGKVALTP
ncbi:MAG: NADPH:quinone oxidoreductase family protein [Ilumatobacteraceae bacterium]|nr:NADPH:quinone oxidoreductase family protein [Ilumatobacteraceae bacterium]